MSSGQLHLIIGPMFAGKSTELIRKYRHYKLMDKRILVVNHIWNSRFGLSGVSTHDLVQMDASNVITTNNLQEIYNYLENIDVVFIEELQFFESSKHIITNLVDVHHKIIIASGLDGSAEREPMGDVLTLIPHADTVQRLSALCAVCRDGTPAIFSSRIQSPENSNVDVGGSEKYTALCRKHFLAAHPELLQCSDVNARKSTVGM